MSNEVEEQQQSLGKAASLEKGSNSEASSEESAGSGTGTDGYLDGWRFILTLTGLYIGQVIVALEMTIVTTALVAITNDLKDFRHSTWIANAYFLVWSGTLVLWAQFSHTVGRKTSFLAAVAWFVIWSAACAASQTALELYIFRALQGLAGAGVFSLTIVIISEAKPPAEIPKYAGGAALLAVVAMAAGPIMGGAIADKTTWRWVFILNVPAGCIAFATILLGMPAAFPHQNKPEDQRPRVRLGSFKQMDLIGGALFLGFAIMSVTAFQEADTTYPWKSATIICLFVFSGVCGIAFVFWQRYVTFSRASVTPLMTWHFLQRRTMAMFVSSFFIGAPFVFTLVQIPQRLQVIDGFSPLHAAVHLLPFSVLFPVGSVLGSIFSKGRFQSRPVYGQLLGAALQLTAVVCFATDGPPALPSQGTPARQYGFQILLGLGSAFSYMCNFNGMALAVGGRAELVAPAMGANTQFRYLGAAMGLGAVTAAFNSFTRARLSGFLDAEQIAGLLQSSQVVSTLGAAEQVRVFETFATAFTMQWKIMCGFVGAQIVAILFTY